MNREERQQLWQARMADYRQSGLTLKAWCALQEYTTDQLKYWLYKRSPKQFQLNPFSTAQLVFCNRQRNKLKILQWDHAGFWLYYRRLEQETFAWPKVESAVRLLPASYYKVWAI